MVTRLVGRDWIAIVGETRDGLEDGRKCFAFGAVMFETYGKDAVARKIDRLAMETSPSERFSDDARYATQKFWVLFAHLAKTALVSDLARVVCAGGMKIG